MEIEWKLAEDQKKEIVKGLWKLLKKKRMKIKRKIQEMKRIEKREESVPGGYIPAVEKKKIPKGNSKMNFINFYLLLNL